MSRIFDHYHAATVILCKQKENSDKVIEKLLK